MGDRKTVEKIIEIYEDSLADWERDLPELVRCKNCKNWKDKTKGFCQLATHGWEKENWYCADGVRK